MKIEKTKEKGFINLKIGDSISFINKINNDQIKEYSKLSGDYNPIHFDKEFARKTIFKEIIVPGFLHIILGSKKFFELCGANYIIVSFSFDFLKPVKQDENIHTTIKIIEKIQDKKMLKIEVISKTENTGIVSKGNLLTKYIGFLK